MTKDRPTGIVSTPTHRLRNASSPRTFNSQFMLAAIIGTSVLTGFLAGFYARGFVATEPAALADMPQADVQGALPKTAVAGAVNTPKPSAQNPAADGTQAQPDDLPLSFYTLLPNDRVLPEQPPSAANPEPDLAVPEAVPPNIAAPDAPLKAANAPPAVSDSAPPHLEVAYVLQVGSFRRGLEAEKRKSVLLLMGFHAVYTERYTNLRGKRAYRVMLGPFAHRDDVRSAQSRLQAARLENFMRIIQNEADG